MYTKRRRKTLIDSRRPTVELLSAAPWRRHFNLPISHLGKLKQEVKKNGTAEPRDAGPHGPL